MRSKPSSARTNRRPLSCVAAPCSGHLVCDDLERARGVDAGTRFRAEASASLTAPLVIERLAPVIDCGNPILGSAGVGLSVLP
jgi:hypothetical protein